MSILKRSVFVLISFFITASAQYYMSLVTPVSSRDATAFSNSHKIGTQMGEWYNNTIHIVYHTDDSVYYIHTTDFGHTWQTPWCLGPGKYPACDIDIYGLKHVAWQQYNPAHNAYDIYYDCLDDWTAPLNVTDSPGNSTLPDLVVDSAGVVHITWEEEISGYTYIFYRSNTAGTLSDTFRCSSIGSAQATFSHPSISIYQPNNTLCVVWDCYDPDSYSPYQIHLRYQQNGIWSEPFYYAHFRPLRHPSLDFCHGAESVSLCYEDSSSGNLEATFIGGNGGGYQTQGRSDYPVISTVGSTWSYLFWQEDSAGYEDILFHLYYFMTGWTNGSLRTLFTIDEPVHYPNVCGAYLVWTQGASAPYNLYFADFGYPIGIAEHDAQSQTRLSITPNPFCDRTEIHYPVNIKPVSLKIYDEVGKVVKDLYTRMPVSWYGDDNIGNAVPAGTYFCVLRTGEQVSVAKIVKTK